MKPPRSSEPTPGKPAPGELTQSDRDRVRELLGREPRGVYTIVVRDDHGDPVVLENAPLLADGTPMPTRFWLIGPEEHRRIGQLESRGGVNAAEAAIDPTVLAHAHERYAAERDQHLPDNYDGPIPSGGVGGTRVGVKCLHAHWAWYLAGGDDPVGHWIASQLDAPDSLTSSATRPHPVVSDPVPSPCADEATTSRDDIAIGAATTGVMMVTGTTNAHLTFPWGATNLTQEWIAASDPPDPADLTNALGAIDDELDDIARAHPTWRPTTDLTFRGPGITALVRLEVGSDVVPSEVRIERNTVEELFRLTATSTISEREHNPGFPSEHAADIVAVCCIVLAIMRRFQLAEAVFIADDLTARSARALDAGPDATLDPTRSTESA